MKDVKKPVMVIVSDDIRRDSHAALTYFSKIKVIHLYRLARYGDMTKEDFKDTVQYKDSSDLYRQLIKIKPDIIQGPEPYASRAALLNSLKVLKYAKKYKVPFFYPMFENIDARTKFGPITSLIMVPYLKQYTTYATKVIPMNQGAKDNLQAAGVPKSKFANIIWATWGVDEAEFHPDDTKKSTTPQILFVGKIEAQKGVNTLLRAFDKVKQVVPDVKLRFVGFGSLAKVVSTKKQVEYVGVVKNKDIPQYYQEAWVVAAPSIATKIWAEQVGMVNIQAIACGTPVVSTFSGAIPQYIPDGEVGVLIPEDDDQKLAQALEKILTDQKFRDKLAKQGSQYAKDKYLVKDNIKRAENFVLGLLNNEK